MNSRDSSSPASFHSKITYRRPQFRQLVQGARLGSSFHGINALRSNSDIASALVWNFPSCSSQWASSSISNILLPFRVERRFYDNYSRGVPDWPTVMKGCDSPMQRAWNLRKDQIHCVPIAKCFRVAANPSLSVTAMFQQLPTDNCAARSYPTKDCKNRHAT